MVRRTLVLQAVLLITCVIALSGCGVLYTDIKTPLPALSVETASQHTALVGRASCTSYLWIITIGDCSLQAALEDGNISKIHHVDSEFKSYIFGLYTTFTTVVYGEG
ncbi:MAG: TRL-like family protein [Desulfomonilia bacterium]